MSAGLFIALVLGWTSLWALVVAHVISIESRRHGSEAKR